MAGWTLTLSASSSEEAQWFWGLRCSQGLRWGLGLVQIDAKTPWDSLGLAVPYRGPSTALSRDMPHVAASGLQKDITNHLLTVQPPHAASRLRQPLAGFPPRPQSRLPHSPAHWTLGADRVAQYSSGTGCLPVTFRSSSAP